MKTPDQVRTRQDLLYLLSQASELEHSLSCQYLYAAFTLKEQGEDGVTDEQAAVIQGWRSTLVDVAVQEMLHLGLASNLMTAVGGAPYFQKANFPQAKTYTSLNLDFRLAPVTPKTMRRFVCFELPPKLASDSRYRAWPVAGQAPINWTVECDSLKQDFRAALTLADETPLLPGQFDYSSIGDLYELIEGGFAKLHPGDEDALFIGPPEAQTAKMWKQLIPVTDRKSASIAIDTILKQGEGAYGDDVEIAEAHFGRFVEVWTQLVEGQGGEEPARDVVENPVFTLHHDIEVRVRTSGGGMEAVRPTLITSDVGREANEIFISIYELALQILMRYFADAGEDEEQRYILKQAFLSLMRFCIAPLGTAITYLPAFDEQDDGPRAGPSFELFSDVGLLPQLSSAWRYFRERFTELAKASQALAESDLSKPFPKLRQALVGVENAPALPGLASVFEQYALLVNLSLEPPAEWTWDNGIRALISPLDILRMGTWLASEDTVRENVKEIVLRLTGTGGLTPMPPDFLLGDPDAPPRYVNPEGRWTHSRISTFIEWASRPGAGSVFTCPDEPTWYNAVKRMFTKDEILCMQRVRGLDLGDYQQVKSNADHIYQQVRTGSMPPGQPWAQAQKDCLKKWIDAGHPQGEPARLKYTWRPTAAPQASSRYDDIWFTDENTGWAVNSNGHILHTKDGGDSWVQQFQTPLANNGRAIYLRCIGFSNPTRGWAGTISKELVLFDTTDGETWNAVEGLPDDAPVKICGLSVVSEKVIYFSGTNEPEDPARVMKTTDGGGSWTVFDMSEYATLLVDCYFWDERRGVVVGGLNRTGADEPGRNDVKPVILFTEDGGETWEDRAANIVEQFPLGEWGWKIDFVTDTLGFVSLENFTQGAIAKTTDGGQSWVRLTINDPQANANLEGLGFIDEHQGWAGGWGNPSLTGGYTSATSDGGANWTDGNEVGQFINRFRFFGDPVTVGYASGRTVYKMVVDDGATPQRLVESQPAQPQMLSTVAPSAFSRSVRIDLTVPEGQSRVTLHIWNQFGRPVRTLLDEQNPATGKRTVTWDGTDDDGRAQSSGVYIYRLTTDKDAESRVIRFHTDE